MQLELVRLQHTVGITFVIVTHDQDEALSMANRIAVMEGGKVRQVAPPAELYEFPNSRFVADFIGKMNLFEAKVAGADNGRLLLDVRGLDRIAVPFEHAARGDIAIAVRPEKVRIDRDPPGEGRIGLRGRVSEVAYYGDESTVFFDNAAGVPVSVNVTNESRRTSPAVAVGDEMWLSWAPADTLVLTE
jgi:ABC-type Fe3+/spermidine/putrescine transport system ATPase subunit